MMVQEIGDWAWRSTSAHFPSAAKADAIFEARASKVDLVCGYFGSPSLHVFALYLVL